MSNTTEKTPLILVKRNDGGGGPRWFMLTASGGRLPEVREVEAGMEEPAPDIIYAASLARPRTKVVGRKIVGVRFVEAQPIVHQSIEEAVAQARKAIKAHPNAQFDPEIGGVDVQGATPELLEAMALVMRHGGVE